MFSTKHICELYLVIYKYRILYTPQILDARMMEASTSQQQTSQPAVEDNERGALVMMFAKKVNKVAEHHLDDLTFDVMTLLKRYTAGAGAVSTEPRPGTSTQSEVLY